MSSRTSHCSACFPARLLRRLIIRPPVLHLGSSFPGSPLSFLLSRIGKHTVQPVVEHGALQLSKRASVSLDQDAFEMPPGMRIMWSLSQESLFAALLIGSAQSVTLNSTCCVCIMVTRWSAAWSTAIDSMSFTRLFRNSYRSQLYFGCPVLRRRLFHKWNYVCLEPEFCL